MLWACSRTPYMREQWLHGRFLDTGPGIHAVGYDIDQPGASGSQSRARQTCILLSVTNCCCCCCCRAEVWSQAKSLAPPEVWAALGGFLLSSALHALARWYKVWAAVLPPSFFGHVTCMQVHQLWRLQVSLYICTVMYTRQCALLS